MYVTANCYSIISRSFSLSCHGVFANFVFRKSFVFVGLGCLNICIGYFFSLVLDIVYSLNLIVIKNIKIPNF